MVEVPRTVAGGIVAAAAGLVLLALFVLVGSFRRRRSLNRRLAAVATRLELPGTGDAEGREDTVSRLERLAQAAVLRVSDAEAVADRMAGALHQVAQGVIVCDEHGEVIYRNDAAGALARSANGDGLTDEAVTEVLRGGLRREHRSRTIELLGPPRQTLVVSGTGIDDGRRMVGAVAVVDDVSERRRLDVIRRDFVTNVSTELKTPVGALGLVANTLVSEDDPRLIRRLAQRVQEEAVRVGRIVDDLMELSRIDADALPAREPVPVHLVVAQAVEGARSVSRHHRVVIDAAEAPRRLRVVGDRRQLVSAVRHLVENAVKFSVEGSEVHVGVGVVDGWVEISVQDQGPGIPARELDRIFECFYRVDQSRTSDTGGTGLGLTIASQVAGCHGGDVRVASVEGEGSTFTLRLPAVPRSVRLAAAEAG